MTMRYQYCWCSRSYHLWCVVRTARTIRDLEKSRRDQRNQILTLDVSTSSNLAIFSERVPFHKCVCLSRSYCISSSKQDQIAGELKRKSTASIFSETEKILPSGKVSNIVQTVHTDKHMYTHTQLFLQIVTPTLFSTRSALKFPFNDFNVFPCLG